MKQTASNATGATRIGPQPVPLHVRVGITEEDTPRGILTVESWVGVFTFHFDRPNMAALGRAMIATAEHLPTPAPILEVPGAGVVELLNGRP